MDTFEHCGDLLRRTREQKGLSLRDIEKGTSIRMAYLNAIEEGQIQGSISPVYAMGFIRQYAQFLGMSQQDLAESYPGLFRTSTAPTEFSYGIGTLEIRGAPHGGVRMIPNWAIVGAVLGIVTLLYWCFTWFQASGQ
jgi:cytoskeletal protein RodZ